MARKLALEIEELRAAARARQDRHHHMPRVDWPADARMAVNFTADFDAMLVRRLHDETPMQRAKGEFGGRVGAWRLLELFDRHGIGTTFFTPGRIVELFPTVLRQIAERGHELADHMWEHRIPADPRVERDHMQRTRDALASLTGKLPVGTRSRHSQSALIELGYIYNSIGFAAPLPYKLKSTHGDLLNLPFHFALDDAMYFNFGWFESAGPAQRLSDPERVMEIWWQAFRQQYDEGGYLNICLHPFVSGHAARIEMLDALIVRMKGLPNVWFPTCEAVARHCIAAFPSDDVG